LDVSSVFPPHPATAPTVIASKTIQINAGHLCLRIGKQIKNSTAKAPPPPRLRLCSIDVVAALVLTVSVAVTA
jgi:hypothetical protein